MNSEMIHDFITDLARDRLPARDFASNEVMSARNIDNTGGKIKKVPEVSGNLKSNEVADIDAEAHMAETMRQ